MRRKKMLLHVALIGLVIVGTACSKNKQQTESVSDNAQSTATVSENDGNKDFVNLAQAVPDAILEIRYYSTYNFVGSRIEGYREPVALLSKQAAAALKKASDELVQLGYRLKIYDAYRPQKAVDHFVRWSKNIEDTLMKRYFYPDLDKSVLFAQEYIAEKSGHTRGSTVDLTLFDMTTEKEVDMGGTFDFFGEQSHPDYKKTLTDEQYSNRMLLRNVMIKHGFKPLDSEWWHFTLKDEPFPDTYFDFDVKTL
ncbi:MAG: M15 family metallopeptidase [Bacteroidales bacterium]|nr:M15 family metallopeptidase [Bacteroidales bacterium]